MGLPPLNHNVSATGWPIARKLGAVHITPLNHTGRKILFFIIQLGERPSVDCLLLYWRL